MEYAEMRSGKHFIQIEDFASVHTVVQYPAFNAQPTEHGQASDCAQETPILCSMPHRWADIPISAIMRPRVWQMYILC